ncbi:MAG TPA: acyltransferase family protein [Acidimicrobiia bacterium]|nr:acyltransferase family protein [Acidimicrobiia bacterium]
MAAPSARTHRTNPARRDAIDVARMGALALVVLGHLALAVIDRAPDGDVRGENLLALYPDWTGLTVLAPMPVFFAAAGWANVRGSLVHRPRQLRTLVGVGAVVVGAWSAVVVIADAVGGDPGLFGDGARIATQPLWFLAAYVPFAVSGERLARAGARAPVLVIGSALALLALLDAARFAFDAPSWVGWPGFFVAWGIPWIAGAWWRDRWEGSAFSEARTGMLLALGAATAAAVLVATFGYSAALIDTTGSGRSNTTPPTLYTAVAALAQVGLLQIVAGGLDRIGRRWRRLWARAGELAIGVYVWHLTALALCVGLVSLGGPAPSRLTAAWWWTRPVWWFLVLIVCAAIVLLTARVRIELEGRGRSRPRGTAAIVAGVALVSAGAAYLGLRGPTTALRATLCTATFVLGWWLIGTPEPAPPLSPDQRRDAT